MNQIHCYPHWEHSDLDRWKENNTEQQAQWDEFLREMQSGREVEIDATM